MKKSFIKVLSLVLALALCGTVFAGCNGSGGKGQKIRLLVPNDMVEETEAAIKAFEAKYKDIKVELVYSATDAGSVPTELSKLAASKNMPEVAFGVENFGFILSQGLAYPLDNLYDADPDKDQALQAGINNYTYFDHLYALPWRVQFNGIMVNLDLIETKNLDEPTYDWTIDEFVDLAKKSTDNKYSGINIIAASDPTHNLDTKLMGGLLSDPQQLYGYDMATHQFNFTNGAWAKSKTYVEELKSVPGLISDSLKEWDKRNNGIADAYDQKFGGNADAFVAGKVLMGNHNSWETSWMLKKLTFDWDLYPVPSGEGVDPRIQTHIDYVCLTTSVTEDTKDSAYKLAKFLSYDKDGCLARMEFNKTQLGEGVAIYTPATENKEVIEKYVKSDYIKPGLEYMLKKIIDDPSKIFIADANKIIPNFWNDLGEYRTQIEKQITNGGDPYALAADYEKKVNEAVKYSWESFVKKMDSNLKAFYESHPYEKK